MTIEVGSKVFVTKWALSGDLVPYEVTDIFDTGNFNVTRPGLPRVVIGKGHVHETIESAQARVREMAAAKLKSLDKQRAKLEKLARDGAKVKE